MNWQAILSVISNDPRRVALFMSAAWAAAASAPDFVLGSVGGQYASGWQLASALDSAGISPTAAAAILVQF